MIPDLLVLAVESRADPTRTALADGFVSASQLRPVSTVGGDGPRRSRGLRASLRRDRITISDEVYTALGRPERAVLLYHPGRRVLAIVPDEYGHRFDRAGGSWRIAWRSTRTALGVTFGGTLHRDVTIESGRALIDVHDLVHPEGM